MLPPDSRDTESGAGGDAYERLPAEHVNPVPRLGEQTGEHRSDRPAAGDENPSIFPLSRFFQGPLL